MPGLRSIVSTLGSASGAFRRLRMDDNGARIIGLEPRPSNCGIYTGDKGLWSLPTSPIAVSDHSPDRWLHRSWHACSAGGCISKALGKRTAAMETLVDTLSQLPHD